MKETVKEEWKEIRSLERKKEGRVYFWVDEVMNLGETKH